MKLIIFLLLAIIVGCGRPEKIYDKIIVTDINGTYYVLTFGNNWSDYSYRLDTIKLPNDSLKHK